MSCTCWPAATAACNDAYLTQISVLADTSYNSLSVDEVAAQHAKADCVVNFSTCCKNSNSLLEHCSSSICTSSTAVSFHTVSLLWAKQRQKLLFLSAGPLWQGFHESSVMLASIFCLWSATSGGSNMRCASCAVCCR